MASLYKRPGSNTWYVQYTLENGKQVKRSLGTSDKRLAEKELHRIEEKLWKKEHDLNPKPKEDRCVWDFFNSRIRLVRETKFPSTAGTECKRLEQIRDFLVSKNVAYLNEVRTESIEEFMAIRSKTCAVKTLNEQLRVIKSAFECAVDNCLIQKNPAKPIKKYRRADRDRHEFFFWSPEEVQKIADEAETDCDRETFMVLVNTGMRLGEMMHLEWSDVDFKNRIFHVRNKPELNWWTKTRNPRQGPLNDAAREALIRMEKKRVDNFAVYDPAIRDKGNYWHRVKKMMRAAGVEKGSVHCTRHTFASNLIAQGVELQVVSKLLGHADIRSTMIYAHLQPEKMHDAVSKLNLLKPPVKESNVIPFQRVKTA